jgi:aryl-alcohol dehydrogenase-like predicted oxidoreductase
VDILLLHEPAAEHLTDELLMFLEDSVRKGKVRYFGLSGEMAAFSPAPDILRNYSTVMQFENSVLMRNLRRISTADSRLIITYRALNQTFARLRQHLATGGESNRWSASLDLDCSNANVLSGLLFAWACNDNSNGIVLFSTSSVEHLRQNVASVAAKSFSLKQLLELEKLVSSACL